MYGRWRGAQRIITTMCTTRNKKKNVLRVEVWKNKKCCGKSVSQLNGKTENMFSISFRKFYDQKKENNLFTLIINM